MSLRIVLYVYRGYKGQRASLLASNHVHKHAYIVDPLLNNARAICLNGYMKVGDNGELATMKSQKKAIDFIPSYSYL